MLTKFSSWVFYISSYIPLFLIFIVNNIFSVFEGIEKYKIQNTLKEAQHLIDKFKNLFQISDVFNSIKIILSLALVCLLSLLILIYILKTSKNSSEILTIDNIKKDNQEIVNYLLVYIIPFISIDTTSTKDLIIFSMLFLVIGIICVENGLVYINPTLYFIGYSVYKVNAEDVLISKKSIFDIKRNAEKSTSKDCSIKIKVALISKNVYLYIE